MNDSNQTTRTGYVLIKGITEEGKRFRPSDWAERLATGVARFGADRRIHFHPHVRMVDRGEGKCVIVDVLLEREEPHLFQFLMQFAKSNRLKIETDHVRARCALREGSASARRAVFPINGLIILFGTA